jgi:hypothetical protein
VRPTASIVRLRDVACIKLMSRLDSLMDVRDTSGAMAVTKV